MEPNLETQPTKQRISTRIGNVAESATLAIDAKAKALKSQGVDVVGFGAGEPDFPTPDRIAEAAAKACLDPKNHRYTPTAGLPELRHAIAAKTKRDSGLDAQASQVLVTNGGKHAIFNTFATLVDEGDEVLIPSPYWTTYPEAVKLAGGIPIEVPTTLEHGFKVRISDLDKYLSPRTKLFVHVSPSNPTGAVYDLNQSLELANWLVDHDLWVMADEIYEHLVYDDNKSWSLPVIEPRLADKAVIVNGVAKTYAMTGWRVGWMVGPEDVISAATNLQSQSTSNVSNVAQRAAVEALEGPLDDVANMKAAFGHRRTLIHKMLNEIPGIECPLPEGAFYAYASLNGLLNRNYGGEVPTTTSRLAEIILDQARVAIVPGEAFGTPGYARFSYALGQEDISKGIGRIGDLVAKSKHH
ncbi:MAG: pyridoxal phosphate-dependent aminotransferase [Acidimicrobiaceae bacterium]|nr:pyridoxal phosphate-dependent aminotransferase [Acidimicrobiaceae bacterium]